MDREVLQLIIKSPLLVVFLCFNGLVTICLELIKAVMFKRGKQSDREDYKCRMAADTAEAERVFEKLRRIASRLDDIDKKLQ